MAIDLDRALARGAAQAGLHRRLVRRLLLAAAVEEAGDRKESGAQEEKGGRFGRRRAGRTGKRAVIGVIVNFAGLADAGCVGVAAEVGASAEIGVGSEDCAVDVRRVGVRKVEEDVGGAGFAAGNVSRVTHVAGMSNEIVSIGETERGRISMKGRSRESH